MVSLGSALCSSFSFSLSHNMSLSSAVSVTVQGRMTICKETVLRGVTIDFFIVNFFMLSILTATCWLVFISLGPTSSLMGTGWVLVKVSYRLHGVSSLRPSLSIEMKS